MDNKEEVVIIENNEKNEQESTKQNSIDESQEFIPLEELDTIKQSTISQEEQISHEPKEKKLNKRLIILISAGLLGTVLLVMILFLLLNKNEEPAQNEPPIQTEPVKPIENSYKIDKTRIEDMIKKANSLYENGDKFEALKIYENVAIYNEALSYYNLGVSQMNQEKFQDAITSFQKAITNHENTDVSALNAAVCALHLKDEKLFHHYLDIARAYLTKNSSGFLYYSALINYYRGYYIEALYILNSIKDNFYSNNALYLRSKILSMLRLDKDAINELNKVKDYNINLPLGLLNARMGNYHQALTHLNKIKEPDPKAQEAKLASTLILLKLGMYASAAQNLKELNDKNASIITSIYPIKTALKDDFFNLNAAQKSFREKDFFHKQSTYGILFYYTPYQVFNADQTIEYTQKGGISVFINQNKEADEYLKASGLISSVNAKLTKAISKVLSNELRSANKLFKELIKQYPNHHVLQFNLALSYAQLFDFANAYKHFITSYHLNPKNHLAGIYAVICAQVIHKDYRNLYNEVSDGINADDSLEQDNFYSTLLFFVRDNTGALNRWLDQDKAKDTLEHAFSYIASVMTNRKDESKKHSLVISKTLPNDLLSGLLEFLAYNEHSNIKEYAKNVQINFFNAKIDLSAIYGGSSIVREIFVKLLQISGLVDTFRNAVIQDLKLASADKIDGMRTTLAYLDLFSRHYDEAYEILNDLVHNKKENDAQTLFLAAAASVGAGHLHNGVAYLELAKLTNPTAPGNRVALGFLYHELGNIPAAISQYESLGNSDYLNRFFTFHLAE